MSGANTKRRQRRLAIAWASSLLLGLLLGLVLQGQTFGLPDPALIVLRLGVLVALLVTQIFYWRTLDELARAIQLRAFFWAGLTAWGSLLLLVLTEPLFPVQAAAIDELGAMAGAMLIISVHGLLYLLLWGWAWMKPR